MQKIIIENFRAIQYAEIELNKVVVFIGEQASGKSTIAQLIYFFKTLPDEIAKYSYKLDSENDFNAEIAWKVPIEHKFYSFFGATYSIPNFKLKFYYCIKNEKYIILYLSEKNKLLVEFSELLVNNELNNLQVSILDLIEKYSNNDNFGGNLNEIGRKIIYQSIRKLTQGLSDFIRVDEQYIIAGRNATVSYSSLFEKYLFANVQRRVEEQMFQGNVTLQRESLQEFLMLDFIEHVDRIKNTFQKYGDFDGLIATFAEDEDSRQKLQRVQVIIEQILKGKYTTHYGGEKITLADTQEQVFLTNASSGQQEVIRIVQDIFLNILYNTKVLRILEEPEAHLFPTAQKQLIELLTLMVNHDKHNQLIITTHSPYILTVFNNLLTAHRVVAKNPKMEAEVTQIIPKDFWLKQTDISVYALQRNKQTGKCTATSVIDPKTQLIQQNYLDEVSELLGAEFNALYRIHAKTFARR